MYASMHKYTEGWFMGDRWGGRGGQHGELHFKWHIYSIINTSGNEKRFIRNVLPGNWTFTEGLNEKGKLLSEAEYIFYWIFEHVRRRGNQILYTNCRAACRFEGEGENGELGQSPAEVTASGLLKRSSGTDALHKERRRAGVIAAGEKTLIIYTIWRADVSLWCFVNLIHLNHCWNQWKYFI